MWKLIFGFNDFNFELKKGKLRIMPPLEDKELVCDEAKDVGAMFKCADNAKVSFGNSVSLHF